MVNTDITTEIRAARLSSFQSVVSTDSISPPFRLRDIELYALVDNYRYRSQIPDHVFLIPKIFASDFGPYITLPSFPVASGCQSATSVSTVVFVDLQPLRRRQEFNRLGNR